MAKRYEIPEDAVTTGPHVLNSTYWPLAGTRLTPELMARWEIPADADIASLDVPNTHHDYTVANGYLVPYYRQGKQSIQHRTEETIIDRSRAWILNAQPQLSVTWSREQIENAIASLGAQLNAEGGPSNPAACASDLRLVCGAIMQRIEQLGRAIKQHNTYGTKLTRPHLPGTPVQPMLPMDMPEVQIEASAPDAVELSPAEVEEFRKEYKNYYTFLNLTIKSLMPLVLLTDKRLDRDGVLLDFMREIGKPLNVTNEGQVHSQSHHIVNKIGDTMKSIDQIYIALRKAMTEGRSGELFTAAAEKFVLQHGAQSGIRSVNDILASLDDYAIICRARAGVKTDDAKGYRDVFSKLDQLETFFNAPSGFLQSLRREGRGEREFSELRQAISTGIRLMARTAYTRTPCNSTAPEIWVPNLDPKAPPMEKYMAQTLLSPEERKRDKDILRESMTKNLGERESFLNQKFCSLGVLTDELERLENKFVGTGTDRSNGPRGRAL